MQTLHTADLQILDPVKGQCNIDVRVITSTPGQPVGPQLERAEKKLLEYGIHAQPSLSMFEQLTPCVIESAGCMGASARQTFSYLHNAKIEHMLSTMGARSMRSLWRKENFGNLLASCCSVSRVMQWRLQWVSG